MKMLWIFSYLSMASSTGDEGLNLMATRFVRDLVHHNETLSEEYEVLAPGICSVTGRKADKAMGSVAECQAFCESKAWCYFFSFNSAVELSCRGAERCSSLDDSTAGYVTYKAPTAVGCLIAETSVPDGFDSFRCVNGLYDAHVGDTLGTNDVCTPRCKSGFTRTEDSYKCLPGGLTDPPSFDCIGDPCVVPTVGYAAAGGICVEVAAGASMEFGGTCTAQCSDGYEPTIRSATCAGGRLDEVPKCQPKKCDAPTGITEGEHPDGICAEGPIIDSGSVCTLRCADNHWVNRESTTCRKGEFSTLDIDCKLSYPVKGNGICVSETWQSMRDITTEYACQKTCDNAERCHFFSFNANAADPTQKCILSQACEEMTAGAGYVTYKSDSAVNCTVPPLSRESDEGAEPWVICDNIPFDASMGAVIPPGKKCYFECGEGFRVADGHPIATTCGTGGEQSQPTLTCLGDKCSRPPRSATVNVGSAGPCEGEVFWPVLHGFECNVNCLPGFTTPETVVRCDRGVLPTIECTELGCSAPAVRNAAVGGSCAEGDMLEPGQVCTPTCATGFWPSEVQLVCAGGQLSPPTFTCGAEPTWYVEEFHCLEACTNSTCKSKCESTWVPIDLRIKIHDCEAQCGKDFYSEADKTPRQSCMPKCRESLEASFRLDNTSDFWNTYEWRTSNFDCTDSAIYQGSAVPERTGKPGCRWLDWTEKPICEAYCDQVLATTTRVYKIECDDACTIESQSKAGTTEEQQDYADWCKAGCWAEVEDRIRMEEEAAKLLGDSGEGDTVSSDALNALALKVVELETDLADTKEEFLSDVRQALTGFVQSQWSMDENMRQLGGTGITEIRAFTGGSRSYTTGSYAPFMAAVHNHANYINTVGFGEFAAVVNGFTFRTRHNDYKLSMPVRNSEMTRFNKVEMLTFPEVPPTVTGSLDDQIMEMQAYFKAFKEQNTSIRDYKPYFKPALCYLECQWEKMEGDELVEPFESDRHAIAATDWSDLMERMTLFDVSGGKDPLENVPWLPTRVMGVDIVDGRLVPRLVKWGYRVACHPIDGDVETVRLRAIKDRHVMMQRAGTTYSDEDWWLSKNARFKLDPRLSLKQVTNHPDAVVNEGRDYTDLLMEQIPGKDGYGAYMTDDILQATTSRLESYLEDDPERAEHGTAVNSQHEAGPLNTAYYSRYFGGSQDAMGRSSYKRGFNDPDIWAAMTTRAEVAEVSMIYSESGSLEAGEVCLDADGNPCPRVSQRWTYAMPLELIYLTPLFNWNPYNIETVDDNEAPEGKGTQDEPYKNAVTKGWFYRTPQTFYGDCPVPPNSNINETDTADTSADSKWVMLPSGARRLVVASGLPIATECIPQVGNVRLRFPIMPTHFEGSTTWKEIKAVEALVEPEPVPEEHADALGIELMTTAGTDGHKHELLISHAQQKEMADSADGIWVRTTVVSNHAHDIKVTSSPDPSDESGQELIYSIVACKDAGVSGEGTPGKCDDGHEFLTVELVA